LKIEGLRSKLRQLGTEQKWFDWVDNFSEHIKTQTNISDEMKKEFLKVIIDKITVNYDNENKLHLLNINFKIPVVLEKEKGSENGTQISIMPVKRGRKKSNQLTPVRDYSTVTECSPTGQHSAPIKPIYSLSMSVSLSSSNLWTSTYSPYQQELFDIIRKFHEKDGWNFKQISDWLIENNYKTPRGKTFTHTHCWSIYKKKNKSIQRFSREFEPTITDVKINQI